MFQICIILISLIKIIVSHYDESSDLVIKTIELNGLNLLPYSNKLEDKSKDLIQSGSGYYESSIVNTVTTLTTIIAMTTTSTNSNVALIAGLSSGAVLVVVCLAGASGVGIYIAVKKKALTRAILYKSSVQPSTSNTEPNTNVQANIKESTLTKISV